MSLRGLLPRRGFTLIELLVGISIVGVLVAFLIGTLPKLRESVNRATCVSNLRQLGVLTLSYAAENNNQLPRSRENGLFSFVSNILPDIKPSQPNSQMSKLLYCPSDRSGGVATYSITGGYSGDNTGVYLRDSTIDYVQGRFPINAYPRPSQTFLLVAAPNPLRTYTLRGTGSIMNPQQQFDSGGTSIHGGIGANYLYLDGHVSFINTPMSPDKSPLPAYDQWRLGYQAQ